MLRSSVSCSSSAVSRDANSSYPCSANPGSSSLSCGVSLRVLFPLMGVCEGDGLWDEAKKGRKKLAAGRVCTQPHFVACGQFQLRVHAMRLTACAGVGGTCDARSGAQSSATLNFYSPSPAMFSNSCIHAERFAADRIRTACALTPGQHLSIAGAAARRSDLRDLPRLP